MSAKVFIQQVLRFALTPHATQSGVADAEIPSVPLPEHARRFVSRVCKPGAGVPSLTEIGFELQRLRALPAEVTRTRRLTLLFVVVGLPLAVLIGYTFAPVINDLRTPAWQRELERVPAYDALMKTLDTYGDLPEAQLSKHATCKVLAWIER